MVLTRLRRRGEQGRGGTPTHRAEAVSAGDSTDWSGLGGAWRARPRTRAGAAEGHAGPRPRPRGGAPGQRPPRRRQREGRVLVPRPSRCCQQTGLGREKGSPFRDLRPEATSARGGSPRGCRSGIGKPAPLAFSLSAPAPAHSLCHTTLFSPLSVTSGAIFRKLQRSSHRLPLATYVSSERQARGSPAHPRAAPSGDVTRVCKGFPPTPGPRLRSAGGTPWAVERPLAGIWVLRGSKSGDVRRRKRAGRVSADRI